METALKQEESIWADMSLPMVCVSTVSHLTLRVCTFRGMFRQVSMCLFPVRLIKGLSVRLHICSGEKHSCCHLPFTLVVHTEVGGHIATEVQRDQEFNVFLLLHLCTKLLPF